MVIIPAIDIIEGKCVRLSEGDYNRKSEYAENPLEIAKKYEDAGIKRLHLVDLDGAKAKRVINWDTVEKIVQHTSLWVDFGGGVQTQEEFERLLAIGVKQVTGGSIAVKQEATFVQWIQQFGAEKVILGADVKNNKIAVSGWLENTTIDIFDFLEKYTKMGIREVICTDISKDGMLQGPAIALYQTLLARFPDLKLIASGGVSSIDDLVKLKANGLYGAIIGKALYENKISLKDLQPFISC